MGARKRIRANGIKRRKEANSKKRRAKEKT